MYSKELEELIENVLEDGVITEQERAVLCKRAQACGEDPDEVMVVVEGRLAKAKKTAKPSNEKRGNLMHCPACGALVEAGSAKCKECGYVFTNVEATSSVKYFYAKLMEIESQRKDDNDEEIFKKASSMIKAYPIPTAKEDILEFLTLAVTYLEDGKANVTSSIIWIIVSAILIIIGLPLCFAAGAGLIPLGIACYIIYNKFYKQSYEKKMRRVWRAKVSQVIAKGKLTLSGDQEFMQIQEQLPKPIPLTKIWMAIGIIVGIICISLVFYQVKINQQSKEVEPMAKEQYIELCSQLDELETPNEINYKEVETALLKITWTDIDGDRTNYKENFLEKKRAVAESIGSVIVDPSEGSTGKYEYNGAPDKIQNPSLYIKN